MTRKTQSTAQRNGRVYTLKPVQPVHPVDAALAQLEAQSPATANKSGQSTRKSRKSGRRCAAADSGSTPGAVNLGPSAASSAALTGLDEALIDSHGAPKVACLGQATLPAPQPLHPSQRPTPAAGRSVIKLGLDLDLKQLTVGMQYDHSPIKPAAAFSPQNLVEWVKARVEEGHVVWTVYEACGFGYTLHWQLVAAGAHSLVIAPVVLDQQRQRKNDGLDARALCLRLTRYVDGQKDELPVIRVPSVAEQQRRETGRQRDFWKGELSRLANHGRALRLEHEHQSLPAQWWGPRQWKKLAQEVSPFVRGFLEPLREQLLHCQKQLNELTGQLEERVAQESLPTGLGALTMALYDGEVCDAKRFSNRKQVGSYLGCCPSEYTSGGIQRMGGIDRHGNKWLRVLLVEAVWRLMRYQPQWQALQKLGVRLKAGAALRKKTAIALARQLAIDLWRVRTGRATWAQLGFKVK